MIVFAFSVAQYNSSDICVRVHKANGVLRECDT